MSLHRVEIIRDRVARGLSGEIIRQRIFISQVGGNVQAVDRLAGNEGAELLAKLVEITIEHLGHVTLVDVAVPKITKSPSRATRIARAKMPKAVEPAGDEDLPPPGRVRDPAGPEEGDDDSSDERVYAPVLTTVEHARLEASRPTKPAPARAAKGKAARKK